ncbi:hypothetical protein K7J14_02435 [Treponema zuelzerae]|uniref:Uncharacterized protein n=1 Tax=Teretinema zuelzerae TaxID=156 RepID=A0AAE3EF31_9SPIR|nr:hypothetical protein [Teretinema zuelzerae]MCD1653555.1 hypothetical protein [Teretinema zuelzerae]
MLDLNILTLLGGISTGILTGVIGNAIYAVLTRNQSLLPIANYRKEALSKKWVGFFLMPESEGKVEKVDIIMTLRVKGKTILGSGTYSNTTILFKGGFFRDDYFYLNYENSDKSIFQRGMIIFYWPNNPIEIKGKFLGIRRAKDEIAAGDMVLRSN